MGSPRGPLDPDEFLEARDPSDQSDQSDLAESNDIMDVPEPDLGRNMFMAVADGGFDALLATRLAPHMMSSRVRPQSLLPGPAIPVELKPVGDLGSGDGIAGEPLTRALSLCFGVARTGVTGPCPALVPSATR